MTSLFIGTDSSLLLLLLCTVDENYPKSPIFASEASNVSILLLFKKSGGIRVPTLKVNVETFLKDFQPLCSLAILHNFITLFCSEKIHSAQQVFLLLLQRTSNSISHLLNYDSVPNFSFSHCFIRVPFTVMGR